MSKDTIAKILKIAGAGIILGCCIIDWLLDDFPQAGYWVCVILGIIAVFTGRFLRAVQNGGNDDDE